MVVPTARPTLQGKDTSVSDTPGSDPAAGPPPGEFSPPVPPGTVIPIMAVTPLRHAAGMTTEHRPRSLYIGTPGDVIEQWWCPICNAPAHRLYRPGRPRIYCSNSCRQRAYRYRKANGMRTRATASAPCESAFVLGAFGRRHALRHRSDLLANLSDGRRRRVTVCGALARPTRFAGLRHFDFLLDGASSCRSCVTLVLPPGQPPPPIYEPDWPSMMDRRHVHVPGTPPSFDESRMR